MTAMPSRPSERELRKKIVSLCRDLHLRFFAPATSGNISARLDDKRLLLTPTGMSKHDIVEDDLVVVDLKGKRLAGARKPTSESAMHTLIYELRPETEAVVHAHPPTATGFACAGIALDQPLASEFIQALGCAPLAPYGTPGTDELPESLRSVVKSYSAVLLANHGVVCFGSSLGDAYMKLELVEHYARVALTVRQLGTAKNLSEAEVLKLLDARAGYFGLDKAPVRDKSCPAPNSDAIAPAAGDVARIVEEVLKRIR